MNLISFYIAKDKINKKNIVIVLFIFLFLVILAIAGGYVWLERLGKLGDFSLLDYAQRIGAGIAFLTQRSNNQQQNVLPQDLKINLSDLSGIMYEQIAQKGDGVTHLARRALKEYLKKTGQGADLTSEHKIYIEDYIQKRTRDRWLNLGEKLSFSESLIIEAIEKSRQLSDKQLENLKQYSSQVKSL